MEIQLKRGGLGLGLELMPTPSLTKPNPNPNPPLFNGPLVQFPLIPSFVDSLKSIWPFVAGFC